MPTRAGMVWLSIGVIACASVFVIYSRDLSATLMAGGGATISSFVRSVLEALTAVGMSIGVLVALRESVRGERSQPLVPVGDCDPAATGEVRLGPVTGKEC